MSSVSRSTRQGAAPQHLLAQLSPATRTAVDVGTRRLTQLIDDLREVLDEHKG
jgi:hypothetical protein